MKERTGHKTERQNALYERFRKKEAQLEGPLNNIVVSSRVRLARNLSGFRFSHLADAGELARIAETAFSALERNPVFKEYERIDLSQLKALDRMFLQESNLISRELEKGGEQRYVVIGPDARISIMLNEEDHLRMQCIRPGFQVGEALRCISEVDDCLSRELSFAFHPEFGFLSACPTNVGTGLRASVMLHLPALVADKEIKDILELIGQFSLTARGFYGEGSEYIGGFFQISNQTTLGKSSEELIENFEKVVRQVIEKEAEAREHLLHSEVIAPRDTIWRSYGVLRNARILDSAEAIRLLSSIRLGIDLGVFERISHDQLSALFFAIQPANLQKEAGRELSSEHRDVFRAELLRKKMAEIKTKN